MAGLWGLDVQAVTQLGATLNQKSQEIQGILQTLSSQLQSADWRGPDGDRFRNDWDGRHRPALQNVSEALREAGSTAQKNAQQQSDASSS